MTCATARITRPAAPCAPWVQTYSGRAFPLLNPRSSDVYWPDIIYSLSHMPRYNGHAGFYSIAQHCCLVADLLPSHWKLYGLLHDAHEAYIGDIVTPVADALCVQGAIRNLKISIDEAIFKSVGAVWPMPHDAAEAVKFADIRALLAERRDLLTPPPYSWGENEHLLASAAPVIRWRNPDIAIALYTLALDHAGVCHDALYAFDVEQSA